MRVHIHGFHHYSGGYQSTVPAPQLEPSFMARVPLLHHLWAITGSWDALFAAVIFAAFLAGFILRFLWRMAGVLAGQDGIS
jgi:hypothetical protein